MISQAQFKARTTLCVEELESRLALSDLTTGAYALLSERLNASPSAFYVYQDADSGLNHGFPSGKFASDPSLYNSIVVNPAAINDPNAASGVSSDPNTLDTVHGTVFQVSFPSLSAGQFAGLNIEDPENNGGNPRGVGYNLSGATNLVFDARSPTPGGINVQFGVGGEVTDNNAFFHLSSDFTTITIPLNTLRYYKTNAVTPLDLSNIHTLFTVETNDINAPGGGTVLLDNIRFTPVPTSHVSVPHFPVDTQTFGVLPVMSGPVNQPFPPDQANRNISSIYASALTELTLLTGGTPADLANAQQLADTMVYALNHDIAGDGQSGHGDPLPTAPDGSHGLHNAYSSGDLPLLNDQLDIKTNMYDEGLAGQTRLAGFEGPPIPPDTNPDFYLVLDGATGGNNAFAILALTAAYRQFGNASYLDAAQEIGRWIIGNLTDTSGTGYGGYFVGYPDQGMAKILETGKSAENNADIFAAFTELAAIESGLGNAGEAASWTAAANVAGDFVMDMYDPSLGRFNAGTVPANANPGPGPGFDPTGAQRGNDIINKYDFLDSNSFTTLAIASSPRYRNQIDWHAPVQYILDHFAETVTAANQTFQGFDIVSQPTASPGDNRSSPGPNGIAWEFTGQTVELMQFVDALYGDTRFASSASFYLSQLAHAQSSAPFGDGQGLVDATVQNGDQLAPIDQGLTTPFQVIPERVGLPATTWAILAAQATNPFIPVPIVTAITPSTGPTAGGTAVTITGTDFSDTVAVTFGGTAARQFSIISPTEITALAPAGNPGSVDVTVTNLGGVSEISPTDEFTYIAPPVVTAINPSSGPTTGGTMVIITGTNLSDATSVLFGRAPASFTIVSATQIDARSPASSIGSVDITVSTPDGASAVGVADQFRYRQPTTVTVTMNSRYAVPGQPVSYRVTIAGRNGITPTGTVTVRGLSGAHRLIGASTTLTLVEPLGRNNLTVAYSGDANSEPSSASVVEDVQMLAVEPIPRRAGHSALVVGTTAGSDVLFVQEHAKRLDVTLMQLTDGHARFRTTFSARGITEILVYGRASKVQVHFAGLHLPVFFVKPSPIMKRST